MPNYCSNDIYISGDEAQIAQLTELLKTDEETIMERIIPTPEDLADEDWYSWRLNNWGTKWEMVDLTSEYEDDSIRLDYLTAWAPNTPFWETVSARFPELQMTHHYKEEGLCFVGVATYEGGNCSDQTINY